MPEIFTGTPIEAHIVAVFLRAQMAVASFMRGTPVFRVLLFGVLAWAIVLGFARMAAHRHHAGQAAVHIVYRIAMVFLALALLSSATPGVTWSSRQGPWSTRAGVQSDERYAQTLNTETPGLRWYLFVYRALNNLSQATVNATADAFGDPSLARDPTFLPKQLARMGAMALSPDIMRQYDALLRDCADTNAGRVVGAYDTMREWFDLTPRPDAPDCAQMYVAFEAAARAEGAALVQKYPPSVLEEITSALSRTFNGVPARTTVEHMAVASAILKSSADKAGFTEVGAVGLGVLGNQSANTKATFSTSVDRLVEDTSLGFLSNFLGMNVADSVSQRWGGDARAAARKAEAANKFNQLAPLIPSARGFLQGIMALLFVFAAYSVGFGTWRFMYAWIVAEASLCLYKPVAVLGFKVAEYFMREQQHGEAVAGLAQSPLVLGGARILQNQLAQIQTVYLCFEVGAFVIFALGAIACFRPLAAVTNATGAAALASVGSTAMQGYRTFTGGGGAAAAAGAGSEVVVNINRQQGGTGGGGAGGASSGLGIITPSAPQPSTWDKTA
jgi:hypothetical protein